MAAEYVFFSAQVISRKKENKRNKNLSGDLLDISDLLFK